MPPTTFDRAVALVLEREGGYVNDSRDPGGETNFGISKRAYPHLDIARLTEADAKGIYRRDYWQPIMGDDLPAPVAILAFDTAVNQGCRTAIQLLQTAAGVSVDFVIGPRTVLAASKPGVAAEFAALRALRYANTTGVDRYGKGWYRRLFNIFETAVKGEAS